MSPQKAPPSAREELHGKEAAEGQIDHQSANNKSQTSNKNAKRLGYFFDIMQKHLHGRCGSETLEDSHRTSCEQRTKQHESMNENPKPLKKLQGANHSNSV